MNETAPATGSANGYAHAKYAESFLSHGEPRFLPQSGGWILQRRIPGSTYFDAMGCYPLFVCRDWSQLVTDLDQLREELVCLSLVSDPFGDYDPDYLKQCFPDLVIPFKQHYVVDLKQSPDTFLKSHHRRNVRRALGEMEVELCAAPEKFLDDWIALYSNLVRRHHITGLADFSPASFAAQFKVPGLVVFRALRDNVTIGMILWYAQDSRAYYHLGAYGPEGYELGASFALFSRSIEYFQEQSFQWLNLGAGAGVSTDGESGLNRFKQGWSTGTRTAYLCGRIFNRKRYDEIVAARKAPPTSYFPAYRAGEFA